MIVSSKCFGDSMFTGVVLEKTNNSFNLIRNGLEKYFNKILFQFFKLIFFSKKFFSGIVKFGL